MAQINLRKFDMNKIGKGSIVVMIGKRNTGKSYLVKDLLYYKRDIPIGTVISATESVNRFYGDIIPSVLIHDEYTPKIIEQCVLRQEKVTRKMKDEEAKYGHSQIYPYSFMILDDCLYDSSWTKDKNVRRLFMNGRHLKTLVLITSQYSLGIPPQLRGNIDYVFILRENYISNRKRLYEHYAGMFPTFDMFCQIMDNCTSNYECLVIDCVTKSNKVEDMVYWYKADSHENFTLCAPEIWKYNAETYIDEDEEDDQTFDPSSLKKKNTPHISVHKRY